MFKWNFSFWVFFLKINQSINQSINQVCVCVAAYIVGLVLTGVALFLMKSGQPALLYLVPCTLLMTFAIAKYRGELGHMWRGHQAIVLFSISFGH
jgi:hypothetical protein